jgi:hypothetical protein
MAVEEIFTCLPGVEVLHEQLGQQKRRGPNAQHVVEIIIGAAVQSAREGRRYLTENRCAMFAYNLAANALSTCSSAMSPTVVAVQYIDGADKVPKANASQRACRYLALRR